MKIIDDAKNIADIIKELGRMDLYEKILELRGQIVDLTNENNSLVEQKQ